MGVALIRLVDRFEVDFVRYTLVRMGVSRGRVLD